MRKIGLLIVLGLSLGFLGCARNTNSVGGNATGLVLLTSFGEIVLGHANFHSVTSDLENESLTIIDVTHYDANALLGGGVSGDANGLQNVQRSFSMTLTPMEPANEE